MTVFSEWKAHKRRNRILGLALMVVLLLMILLTLNFGAASIGISSIVRILIGKICRIPQWYADIKPGFVSIVWEIRLPRILCGVLIGAGLSVSGVIFQALLRNPLADPFTLGVSTGAAFGASLAIFLNLTFATSFSTTVFAFTVAFLTLLLVIWIAERGGGMLSSSLVLAGIIVGAVFSSAISFLKMLAGENVYAIVFWLMGSLAAVEWSDVLILFIADVFGITAAWYFGDDLNLMTLGDETAQSLGINIKRTRLIFLMIGSCLTAACVAVCGVIGFIGLVVPHLLRFSISTDSRTLIPFSVLVGGLLLSMADNTARLISAAEIPVGVLTTLIGGPFFIWLFTHCANRRQL